MRTYVRAGRRRRSCTPTLDAFFASVEQRDDPRLRGPAGDRRRRGRARGELRGQGVRRPHGDGRQAGAAALPARRSSSRRACRPTPRRAGRCSRCSTTRRRSSRGSRSTRRSSTCAGWSGSRARPPRSPRGCGATSSSGSGCRSPSASPARSSSPRWRAAWPSPTACSLVPPDGELAFLHPLPVERLWGVGPVDGRQAAQPRDRDGRRGRALRRARARGDARPRRRAGTCTRSRTTATRGPCRSRRRRRSIGSQRALGRAPRSPQAIDADLVALVDRVTRRMRAASRVGRTVVLRLRFDDFSRATRSHTLPHPTAQTQTILAAARELLAAAMPMIERRGLTLVGVAVANLDDDRPIQLCSRSTGDGARSTPPSTRSATGSARPPSPAPCCSAATRA